MIETAALFLTVACVPFCLDLLKQDISRRGVFLLTLLATLAILQKITTAVPMLAVMAAAVVIQRLVSRSLRCKDLVWLAVCFGIPLAAGITWTHYTDLVKNTSYLGPQISSAALSDWNWGTPVQRRASQIYREIFENRIFLQNMAGWLGMGLLCASLLPAAGNKLRRITAVCLLAGILPVLLFLNLHYIHSYYQVACVAYLIFALAVSAGDLLPRTCRYPGIAVLVTALLVASNLRNFKKEYYAFAAEAHPAETSLPLQVAAALREEVPPGSAFVALGFDWNSTLAYYAQRKSFTVPDWYTRFDDVLDNPHAFHGDLPLGAVVVWPSPGWTNQKKQAILAHFNDTALWRARTVKGHLGATAVECRLFMPLENTP
jgi:hypothetical protein